MNGESTMTAVPGLPVFRWERIFLFLVATLSSTILLKVGQIQYLEVLYFVEMLVLLRVFSLREYRTRWFRPFLRLGVMYAIFLGAALALAIASLRYDFFYPEGLSVLRYPVAVTISRMVEMAASGFFALWIADEIRKDEAKGRWMVRVYFWTGVASAVYSIVTYPLDVLKIASLGTYSNAHRMRGFYNEGGPYGLYVLSVILIGVTIFRKGWEARRRMYVAAGLLLIAFVESGSKSAFFGLLLLALVNLLLLRGAVKRVVLVSVGVAFFVFLSQAIDLRRAVQVYRQSSVEYERLSRAHDGDVNFVLGRVAGAFIVPRMVAAHPLTGIGWGNYGILRNAPEYRGASAWAEMADEPGLGLLGTAADFGLPLLAYLVICLLVPFWYLRRMRAPAHLANLALLQPIVHLFGAQFNLTYPWVVTAFALGLAFCHRHSDNVTGMQIRGADLEGPERT